MTRSSLAVGLFVGGKGSRLGGVKKGLLAAPDTGEPIARRISELCRATLPGAMITLVGDATGYEDLSLPALADNPPGVGPIGGLRALLEHAKQALVPRVLAIACDLPRLSADLVQRLSSSGAEERALAPRLDGIWQPLFARYPTELTLRAVESALAADQRALLRVLDALGDEIIELPLTAPEAALLRDWDTPEDMLA